MTPEQRHRAAVLERVASESLRGRELISALEAGAPVDPSALCALSHLGGCRGPLQADHPIERQRLKHWYSMEATLGRPLECPRCEGRGWEVVAEVSRWQDAEPEPVQVQCQRCVDGVVLLDELIADGRNGWLLCEIHHHHPHITVPRQWLPASVGEFARDFRLDWSLDRDYPA